MKSNDAHHTRREIIHPLADEFESASGVDTLVARNRQMRQLIGEIEASREEPPCPNEEPVQGSDCAAPWRKPA